MNCTTCKKSMKTASQDISHNHATGQQYNRTIYACEKDDVWITTEIPILSINLEDKVTLTEDLGYVHYRHKATGGKEVLGFGKIGTELHKDTGTNQYRRRQFNKQDPEAPDSYQEEINNPSTGYSVNINEKLSDHKGHGSDKKRKPKENNLDQ